MIIAALHFFESSTNTFHFECGMMTPTLLDVAAITGLSPLGDTYDPCKASDTIKFDFRNKSYSKYIVENRKTSDEVSDEEHVAFLTLWLSQYVFCTQSLQVAKKFIPMAIQLHECQQFNFARLVLGCLYESMRDACEHLKRTGDGSTFLGVGPFWLLQLWLTATFHAELDLFLPEPYYEESRTRQIEGTRLARMVPRERGLSYDVAFQQYFNPFVDRPLGPPWFTHRFPSPPEFEMVTNSIWNAYLMPTVLSCRIGLTSGDFGLVGYFPNLVSRQFGLTQILPKSIYLGEREVCLGKHGMTEPQFHSFLNHFNQPSYELTPFDFAPSHACTREFFTWWSRHYEGRLVDKAALLTAISNGFDSSILNKIKSKLNARGSKSKAGSSNSSKPLPPPYKVELKVSLCLLWLLTLCRIPILTLICPFQIASRKRPHSTETPSVSKEQRPIPATCSSAPDKDIPVLSTIPEQTNVATTQDLPPNTEPITDEKKKKKKKKKEHQSNQEGTPEHKSSEIEAQPDTLASPEDPPLEQSEKKKKKKKKHKNIYLLPDSIIKDIERMMNSFWWGGGANNKGIRWLAWDRMTLPKSQGGMGFRDLHTFNMAMIAKQGWNIMTRPHTLVAKLFKARWSIGNGASIKIMSEPWLRGEVGAWLPSPQPQGLHNFKVHDFMLHNVKMWDKEKIESIFPLHIANRILEIPLFNSVEEDKLVWIDNTHGNYSVKSGYKCMLDVTGKVAGLETIIQPRIQLAGNAKEIIHAICSAADEDTAGLFAMLVWVLWNNRNNKVWNDEHEPGSRLGLKARQLWEEWALVQRMKQGRQTEQQQHQLRWQKPSTGWLKCNVDAGFHKNLNKTSTGWCLRDHLGRFVLAETTWMDGSCSVIEGESIALLEALKSLSQRGISHVIFETDSKSVVDATQHLHGGSSEFSFLICQINNLLSCNPNFMVKFIKRQANNVAHTLARAALSWSRRCTFETLPLCITPILNNEMI
ncbi:unnamed protein product [Trifolium pratense]|uniref:Uncharacterized protein n=1 Tax=Trifolium pratense TaxID=57577 RepID=A0ACB0JBF9_TRIPR|nr:unnamed protein product [Trifolium pratense]